MKNLLSITFAVVGLFAFSACSSSPSKTAAPNGACCSVCPMSGEAVPADGPTSDFQGNKVGFCCDKCQSKWTALSATDKQAKFDKCCAQK